MNGDRTSWTLRFVAAVVIGIIAASFVVSASNDKVAITERVGITERDGIAERDNVVATFSIVAYDPDAKEWGVAVQSRVLAVGSIVPFAKAEVGAIATQSYANTTYGPRGLELLAQGLSAQEVVDKLTGEDDGRDVRQLGVVD